MQLVRHSIAITKIHHRRHLQYNHPYNNHKQTSVYYHYRHTFKFGTTTIHETQQIDLDELPPLDSNQSQKLNAGASQSHYKPHHGSLPAQVMDSLSALNINVQAETHQVCHQIL